ncbi:MAG: glycosyltransferase family 4 protein, partial [Thermoanaerobaculia bacterium]
AALCVDPRRPEAMARALSRLLRSATLRGGLARRGPPQAARFSWGDAALKTLRLYREASVG